MENKLSNYEIAKIFAMYFPCKLKYDGDDEIYNLRFAFIDGNLKGTAVKAKLLLTPLSKLTDEDAIEVAKMETDSIIEEIKDKTSKHFKFGYMSDDGYQICHVFYSQLNANQFQYLIGKGYAVPIFISLNHPLNGLTPIELEIAREK